MMIKVDGQGSQQTHAKLKGVADKLIDVFLEHEVDFTIIMLQMCHNRVTATIDSNADAEQVIGYLVEIGATVTEDELADRGKRIILDKVEVALSQHKGRGTGLASA